MEATFTREPLTSGASMVPEHVSGYVFTPTIASGQRVLFLLSEEDRDAFDNLGRGYSLPVTDLLTGEDHYVRRAACGLGCECGAEVVES